MLGSNLLLQKYKLVKELHDSKNLEEGQRQEAEDFLEGSEKTDRLISAGVMGIKLIAGGKFFYEKILNARLFYEFYSYTQQDENLQNQQFRILLFWFFMNIISNVLITYSSMLHSQLEAGTQKSKPDDGTGKIQKCFRIFYFTFLGQFYSIFIELLFIVQLIAEVLAAFRPKATLIAWQNAFTGFYKAMGLNLTAYEMLTQYDQRRVSNMLFSSISNLFLKILVYRGLFSTTGPGSFWVGFGSDEGEVDGLSDEYPFRGFGFSDETGEDVNQFIKTLTDTLVTSICIDSTNILCEFYLIYCEAKTLRENFLNYSLLSIRGKHGWIPFGHLIETNKLADNGVVAIDYSEIMCYMPGISHLLGIYLPYEYQFKDKAIIQMIQYLDQRARHQEDTHKRAHELWSKQLPRNALQSAEDSKDHAACADLKEYQQSKYQKKPVNMIEMGSSIKYTSINNIIHLSKFCNQEWGLQKLTISLQNAEWPQLVENYKKDRGIAPKERYAAQTASGEDLLEVYIDNHRPGQERDLEIAFDTLLKDRYDVNLIVIKTNEPLILYAFQRCKHGKRKCQRRAYDALVEHHKEHEIFDWQAIIDASGELNKQQPENKYINKKLDKYWLEVCIDAEPEDAGQEWFLGDFMKTLLEQPDFDINIISSENDPILFYAKRKRKSRSLQLLKSKDFRWEEKPIEHYKKKQIIKQKSHQSDQQTNFTLKDSEGKNWLQSIIDTEEVKGRAGGAKEWYITKKQEGENGRRNDEEVWLFEGLMRMLLKEGCNPNDKIELEVPQLTLLEYALDAAKEVSAHLLIEFGAFQSINEQLFIAQNNMDIKPSTEPQFLKLIDDDGSEEKNVGNEDNIKAEDKDQQAISQVPTGQSEQVLQEHENQEQQKDDSAVVDRREEEPAGEGGEKSVMNLEQCLVDLDLLFEIIAGIDLVTDLIFVKQLFNSGQGHNMWFILTAYSMLAPYFVCTIPFLDYQLQQSRTKFIQGERLTQFNKVQEFIIMTPLSIFWLIILDWVYLMNAVILLPLVQILSKLCPGCVDVSEAQQKIDEYIQALFSLTYNQMQGFRRLRQVSQLNFESIPQLFLQLRILLYVTYGDDEATKKDLQVDATALIISILAAFVHIAGELIMLRKECKVCRMDLFEYLVVCYNGRLGWIPFVSNFQSEGAYRAFFEKWRGRDEGDPKGVRSNFDKTGYQFSKNSATKMISTMGLLPEKIDDIHDKVILEMGRSLQDVPFETVVQLLKATDKRVTLELEDIDISKLIEYHHEEEGYLFNYQSIDALCEQLQDIPEKKETYRKIKFTLETPPDPPAFDLKMKKAEDRAIFFRLMQESYKKANVQIDVEMSSLIVESLEEGIANKDPANIKESANRIIHIISQFSGGGRNSDRSHTETISKVQAAIHEKWPENKYCIQIFEELFNKVIKNEEDIKENEMVIENLSNCNGFLEELQFQKALCNYLESDLDIDKYINFIKYDQQISERKRELLGFELTPWRNSEQQLLKALETQDDPDLIEHQQAISKYLRSEIRKFKDRSVLQFMKDHKNLIRFPRGESSFLEYDLSQDVEITDHTGRRMDYNSQSLWTCDETRAENEQINAWLSFKFTQPIYIRGFGLKSAPSSEERDPYVVDITVKAYDPKDPLSTQQNKQYSTLYSMNDLTFEKRQETKMFALGPEEWQFITSLKILVKKVKGINEQDLNVPNNNKHLQLGKFFLYI